mmetsp:Transcript_7346/g.8044  ORF Transcript_7346/g.8044 Transcript_7346/m.8044 type:complete len:88 (-) Transcript_7346:31-294(-)
MYVIGFDIICGGCRGVEVWSTGEESESGFRGGRVINGDVVEGADVAKRTKAMKSVFDAGDGEQFSPRVDKGDARIIPIILHSKLSIA